MASSDNGKQRITFKYQQEGTAQGFNKLLLNVVPYGIIRGGEIHQESEISPNTFSISEGTEFMIGDGNVLIHVLLEEKAYVNVSADNPNQKPYIVGIFNWANTQNNYVGFDIKDLNEVTDNMIIFGKREYEGNNYIGTDYTRTCYQSSYEKYENTFLFKTNYNTYAPSFNVSVTENPPLNTYSLDVNQGKAIINGTEVVKSHSTVTLDTSDTTSPLYFNTYVQYARCDLLLLTSNGNFEYLMGEDANIPSEVKPQPRKFPPSKLPLAKFTWSSGNIITGKFLGSCIETIYNNNYIGISPTIGNYTVNSDTGLSSFSNEHTLFI